MEPVASPLTTTWTSAAVLTPAGPRSPHHPVPGRRDPARLQEGADLAPAQVAEPQVLEGAAAAREVAAEEGAEQEQEPGGRGRRDARGARRRLEEREPQRRVLDDVAVLEGQGLAPEPAREELRLGARAVEALGGAALVVVGRELVVGRRVAPALPRGGALAVHPVDEPPHAPRRAGRVDVEAAAVDRARVQEDQRRVGDPAPGRRPGGHRVAAPTEAGEKTPLALPTGPAPAPRETTAPHSRPPPP